MTDWTATKEAVEKLGPVDLLVNNAGVMNLTKFLEIEEADMKKYEMCVGVCMGVGVGGLCVGGWVDGCGVCM